MKKYVRILVTIRDEGNDIEDEYEVDSCWSQETEMFCEKMAKIVKIFVSEMNGEAETSKCFDIIEQLDAIESGVKRE